MAVASVSMVSAFGQEVYLYVPETRTFQDTSFHEIEKQTRTSNVKSVTVQGYVGRPGIYFFIGEEISLADVLKFAGRCKGDGGRFSMGKASVFLDEKVIYCNPEKVIEVDLLKLKGGAVIYRHGNIL